MSYTTTSTQNDDEQGLIEDISDIIKSKIDKFIQFHANNANRRIAFITSGGTMVKLEQNTVRFLDNFSAGTRGSASAEYFLRNNYAVIFLHRLRSLQPYERHFKMINIFDMVNVDNDENEPNLNDTFKLKYKSLLNEYTRVNKDNLLLKIDFQTIFDYLSLLKYISMSLLNSGNKVLVYLAAAVSDFYLPKNEIPLHKIQSNQLVDGLNINLKQVPKLLGKFKSVWCPNALICSFKLETDKSILHKKCKQSLINYKHELVIGNILNERKSSVFIMTKNSDEFLEISSSSQHNDEIERYIVEYLIDLHDKFMQTSTQL